MKIVVTGASGFIGSKLSQVLVSAGHEVVGLGMSRGHSLSEDDRFRWIRADTTQSGAWQEVVADADAVVNLAGRSILKRWSGAYKREIVRSRLETTRNVVDVVTGSDKILLSTSAVGYYGSRGDEILTESASPGDDFLAHLAVDWEQAAREAEKGGVRVAIMRFGVVLGAGGGALDQMLQAFRMFVGGPIGNGRQWFPWIHMSDLIKAILFLLENETASGPYNFCSPQAIRQKDFATVLGEVLGRPSVVPTPKSVLRLMMGEMADTLFASQKVYPQRLMDDGFSFDFEEAHAALTDLVGVS